MKNKSMKSIILIVVFLFGLVFHDAVEAKIEPFFLRPLDLFRPFEDNPSDEQVITGLKKRIEIDPYDYKNYSILAFFYDAIGDYQNELETLKAGVRYVPRGAKEKDVYYGNLARAYMLNERWRESKEWLDKADEINPHNFFNRWNAFDYYLLYEKDFMSAASQLQTMQEFYSDQRDQYYEAYTKSLSNLVSHEDLIRLFEESVKLEPNNAKAYRALGVAIRNSSKERYEEKMLLGLEKINKALELDPLYTPTYITMGNSFMLLGALKDEQAHFHKALEWFDRAYEFDPKNLKLAYATGSLYFYIKEYDRAIEKL
jgi:tetratricopeptide (TPR) repeat protein